MGDLERQQSPQAMPEQRKMTLALRNYLLNRIGRQSRPFGDDSFAEGLAKPRPVNCPCKESRPESLLPAAIGESASTDMGKTE